MTWNKERFARPAECTKVGNLSTRLQATVMLEIFYEAKQLLCSLKIFLSSLQICQAIGTTSSFLSPAAECQFFVKDIQHQHPINALQVRQALT
jgi:hypothetical protein